MDTLRRRMRGVVLTDAALLLGLTAVFVAAAALLIWPDLLGEALGRPRVG